MAKKNKSKLGVAVVLAAIIIIAGILIYDMSVSNGLNQKLKAPTATTELASVQSTAPIQSTNNSTVNAAAALSLTNAKNPKLKVDVTPNSVDVLDIGEALEFTAFAKGGIPKSSSTPATYIYQWYNQTGNKKKNAVAMPGMTSDVLTFSARSVGEYSYFVKVTDPLGNSIKSANVVVDVVPSIAANSPFTYTGSITNMITGPNCACEEPIGIGAYGLVETPSGTYPYTFSTNEITGIAQISSLSANTFTPGGGGGYNGYPNGASLQLNSILTVNTTNGVQYYWIQNVAAAYNTISDQMASLSSITNEWTITTTPPPDDQISDTACHDCGGEGSPYGFAYQAPMQTYTLPETINLTLTTSYTASDVYVNFFENKQQFDTVIISTPGVISASFASVPSARTPVNYQLIGTEFVFGGYGDGFDANFTSMDSSMGLYYVNGQNTYPIPGTFDYGTQTAEGANDLNVVPDGNTLNIGVGPLNAGSLVATINSQPGGS